MGRHKRFILLCLLAVQMGCAVRSTWWRSPDEQARDTLVLAGFSVLPARQEKFGRLTDPSPLLAAVRLKDGAQFLTVFIEGDGAAWPRQSMPPTDPTPVNPLALHLAVAHSAIYSESVAYLGRPCQYLSPQELLACPIQWWTTGRFGMVPLALISSAIDNIKATSPNAQLRLVGYSGGGAVAALLAAQRDDVSCLVTVAAPLDTDAWTAAKNVTTLKESLNPLLTAHKLRGMLMTHWTGGSDEVVPSGVNKKFFEAANALNQRQTGFDHHTRWLDAWPDMARKNCIPNQ